MNQSTSCNSLELTTLTVGNHPRTVALLTMCLTLINLVVAQIEFRSQQYQFAHRALPVRLSIILVLERATMVVRHVFTVGHQLKVLQSVVQFITINMMNMLTLLKLATKRNFHNIAMFIHVATVRSGYFSIPFISSRLALAKICMRITIGAGSCRFRASEYFTCDGVC